MSNQKRNRDGHVVATLLLALILLYAFTQLPPVEWNGFRLKPVDLFSDIRVERETSDFTEEPVWQDDSADERLALQIPDIDSDIALPSTDSIMEADTLSPDSLPLPVAPDSVVVLERPRMDGDVVLFEDYSPEETGLSHLLYALQNREQMSRPVRIAFLGDSFIEADIFTQDVRSQLQGLYGGRGVGYMSMHSEFPGFRQSVAQSGSGWECRSVLTPSTADWSVMPLCLQYFIPQEGAKASYKGVTKIARADSWNLSRFVFIAPQACTVKLKVDDADWQDFAVSGSPDIQSIEIRGATSQFQLRLGPIPGFVAIGAWLDDERGIAVDNISVRGFSGLSLSSLSASRCAEMSREVPYDAIVLQYGLNVMQPNVVQYNSYSSSMVSVIRHLQSCYPHTDIIVMGVGDRSRKKGESFVTMPAVVPLSEAQRSAARQTGVVFWDTYRAMGGENSMPDYVDKQQANKDYTHINHKGGRRLAGEFVKSLRYAVEQNEW